MYPPPPTLKPPFPLPKPEPHRTDPTTQNPNLKSYTHESWNAYPQPLNVTPDPVTQILVVQQSLELLTLLSSADLVSGLGVLVNILKILQVVPS